MQRNSEDHQARARRPQNRSASGDRQQEGRSRKARRRELAQPKTRVERSQLFLPRNLELHVVQEVAEEDAGGEEQDSLDKILHESEDEYEPSPNFGEPKSKPKVVPVAAKGKKGAVLAKQNIEEEKLLVIDNSKKRKIKDISS